MWVLPSFWKMALLNIEFLVNSFFFPFQHFAYTQSSGSFRVSGRLFLNISFQSAILLVATIITELPAPSWLLTTKISLVFDNELLHAIVWISSCYIPLRWNAIFTSCLLRQNCFARIRDEDNGPLLLEGNLCSISGHCVSGKQCWESLVLFFWPSCTEPPPYKHARVE